MNSRVNSSRSVQSFGTLSRSTCTSLAKCVAPCSPPIPWEQRGIFLQPHKDVIQLYKEFGPKDYSGFGLQVLWLQPLAQPNSSALCLVP